MPEIPSDLIEIPDKRDQVSPEEWQTRVDLAACYRLADHHGWSHTVLNHISARIPVLPHFVQ